MVAQQPDGLLILGAGRLGSALLHLAQADPTWAGGAVQLLDHAALDVTGAAAIEATLEALRPASIVNCAAYTRVDDAEQEPDRAFATNALGPAFLARSAARIGARLIHVSTDYVFAGAAEAAMRPYREDDLPAPRSVYGASKLAGEHLTLAYAPDALVVRTSGVYGGRPAGSGKRSFVEAILQQASLPGPAGAPTTLRVVADQQASPTYAADLARVLLALLPRPVSGLLHVTSEGSCSWFEFARAIVESAGMAATILPVSTQEHPAAAARPAYSVLDLARLHSLGLAMPHWREALRRYLQDCGVPGGEGRAQQRERSLP